MERLRLERGLSLRALAAALESTGRRIPVLGLQRFRQEGRRTDVDDLLAFAAVLGVTPDVLLAPPGDPPADHAALAAARQLAGWIGDLLAARGDPEAARDASEALGRSLRRIELEAEELLADVRRETLREEVSVSGARRPAIRDTVLEIRAETETIQYTVLRLRCGKCGHEREDRHRVHVPAAGLPADARYPAHTPLQAVRARLPDRHRASCPRWGSRGDRGALSAVLAMMLVLYPWGVMGMMLLPYVSGGASGALLELAAIGGLVLARAVKWGLGRAWPAVFGRPHPRTGRHRTDRRMSR